MGMKINITLIILVVIAVTIPMILYSTRQSGVGLEWEITTIECSSRQDCSNDLISRGIEESIVNQNLDNMRCENRLCEFRG